VATTVDVGGAALVVGVVLTWTVQPDVRTAASTADAMRAKIRMALPSLLGND